MKVATALAVTATPIKLMQGDENASSIKITNYSTSANEVQVNIPKLHGVNGWYPIQKNTNEIFSVEGNGIENVTVKSSGTATIDFGVIARNSGH